MTFDEWKDDYGLVYERNYCEGTEADCLAAFQAGAASCAHLLETLSRVESATYLALLKGDYTSLPAMLADVQGTLAKAKGLT